MTCIDQAPGATHDTAILPGIIANVREIPMSNEFLEFQQGDIVWQQPSWACCSEREKGEKRWFKTSWSHSLSCAGSRYKTLQLSWWASVASIASLLWWLRVVLSYLLNSYMLLYSCNIGSVFSSGKFFGVTDRAGDGQMCEWYHMVCADIWLVSWTLFERVWSLRSF